MNREYRRYRKYLKQRIAENEKLIEVYHKQGKLDAMYELQEENIMFHEKIKDLKDAEL